MNLFGEFRANARLLGLAACLCAFTAPVASAPGNEQSLEVSEEERSIAVDKLAIKGLHDLSRITSRDLDGVKGWVSTRIEEPPALSGVIADPRLDAIRLYACSSAIFGPAELVGEKIFVGKNDTGIFTKLRFRMIDDWRADPDKNQKNVHIVILGGETTWNGERIRIEKKGMKFQKGRLYLLVAGDVTDKKNATIYGDPMFLEIDNNAVYSPPGWTPFPNGTSLKQAKADVSKAVSLRGCK